MSVNNFEFLSREKLDIPDNEDSNDYENDENERFENITENIGENNEQTNPPSEDDVNLIEQYKTGFFIQDTLTCISMYRPFRIFPPAEIV